VFQLLFDSRHGVLLSRFRGTYTADDILLRDKAVVRFVDQHGPARGIMDFAAVEAIDVPMGIVIERCEAPPLLRGTPRVILAPTDLTYRFNKVVAAHQLYSRKVAPVLVRSLDHACCALGMAAADFTPIDHEPSTSLEEAARQALAAIDRAHGAPSRLDDADRRRLRAKVLGLMEAMPVNLSDRTRLLYGDRLLPNTKAITLSDILNAALSHATLTDGDLKTICEPCGKRLTLGICRIVAGRRTTYSCPACERLLVVLQPATRDIPAKPEPTYLFGTFQVRTAADIECVGARLPRSLSVSKSEIDLS
jgi:hypothetical protein